MANESFRNVASSVGAIKEAYRTASKVQRQQMRAWMRRVLANEDGNDQQVEYPVKTDWTYSC